MNLIKTWYACFLASIPLGSYSAQEAKVNLIDRITITPHRVEYQLNKEFHAKYLLENLYVTYQDDIDLTKLDYTIVTMPLIMNVYSMVALSGKDYYIDAMDRDLFNSLKVVHEVLRRFYPKTKWDGRLIPRTLVDNKKALKNNKVSPRIAMPFSHGLDSICTSLRNRTTPQLLMTVRGCPDTPLGTWETSWQATIRAITRFAKLHGHTNSIVYSNFHGFFCWSYFWKLDPEITNWRMDTIEDLGWMGIAAPILVTKGIRKLILAANKDWSTLHPGISSPITNDTMRFANISCRNDSFELSRTEKNFVVARICNENNLEKPTTMVCENCKTGRINCCYCSKCIFTILSFILAGEDPRSYGFDVEITPFLDYFKNTFFPNNVYSEYRAGCYKYTQLKAKSLLNSLDPELQDFFSWFLTIDYDKLSLPSPQIIVDYDTCKDLFPGLPSNWKQYRLALEDTCISDALTDDIYEDIWHNATGKKSLPNVGKTRRLKKRTLPSKQQKIDPESLNSSEGTP